MAGIWVDQSILLKKRAPKKVMMVSGGFFFLGWRGRAMRGTKHE
jgi:hypothetical protein